MTNNLDLWEVRGTTRGNPATIRVRAADHNEAKRIASGRRIVVRDCVLVERAK
jgi:hypothetical protein